MNLGSSAQKIELSGDSFECTQTRCDLIGNVLLTSGSTLLSARALQIDLHTDEDGKRRISGARASGDVLLIDGDAMTACELIELGPDLVQGSLSFAEIRVKKPGSTGTLQGWDRFGAGVDTLYVNGQITRTGKDTFTVRDIYFTPCDCGKGNRPIFSIKAKKGYVTLGSHATFERVLVQPGDVPLPFPFSLPAFYIPVSKRKSGLLPPTPLVLRTDGFYIEEAVFFVLNESVDLTASAGWNVRRGLRDKLELRYNPAADIEGTLSISHMWDRTFGTSPFLDVFGMVVGTSTGIFGPHRFGASWTHRSGTWNRAALKINGQFFSDQEYFLDNTVSFASLVTMYSASRAAFDYRGDAWRISVGAAAYQDFRLPNVTPGKKDSFYSPAAGRTLQRVPDIAVGVAPLPLPAGFRFAMDTRLVGALGFSEQRDVFYTANTGALPHATPSMDVSECFDLRSEENAAPCQKPLRYGRLDLVPRLSRPFSLGPLEVKPELFGLFAAGADAIDTSVRARGFAGLQVEVATMIGRIFDLGKERKLRHRMRPVLRYLLIPGVFGEPARFRFDERDLYRNTHQLQAGFETDLYRKSKEQGATRVLSLSILQGMNLGWAAQNDDPQRAAAPLGLSQLGARLVFEWAPVTVSVRGSLAHMDKDSLKEFGVRTSFADGKYLRLMLDFSHFSNGGYWRMNTGLFELMPGNAVRSDPYSGGLDSATGSVAVFPYRGVSLSYDLTVALSDRTPLFQQMNARVGFTGACGCFGAEVQTSFFPGVFTNGEMPAIKFTLTIGDYTFRPQ